MPDKPDLPLGIIQLAEARAIARVFTSLDGCLHYLTPEAAREIYELFGACSALYECHTPEEVLACFEEDYLKDGDSVQYFLNIQLCVEDGFGTPTAMIEEIRERLNNWLKGQNLRELKDSDF